jgi:hypothetical protein
MAKDMHRQLNKELEAGSISPSFACWLEGRLLVSNPELSSGGCALLIRLSTLKQDQFSMWARSYAMQHLARHDLLAYEQHREEWLELLRVYAETKDHTATDIGWALVCALSASADALDSDGYATLKQLTINSVSSTTRDPDSPNITAMDAIIMNVPVSDFRAWAAALVSVSAARMEDWETTRQDDDQLREALLLQCTDDNDRVLAMSNFLYSDYCLWNARQSATPASTVGSDGGGSSRGNEWKIAVPAAEAALRCLRAPLSETE